jgi:hypothetical protein
MPSVQYPFQGCGKKIVMPRRRSVARLNDTQDHCRKVYCQRQTQVEEEFIAGHMQRKFQQQLELSRSVGRCSGSMISNGCSAAWHQLTALGGFQQYCSLGNRGRRSSRTGVRSFGHGGDEATMG